jgi:ribosomal protein S6--L-glutamate ligase
LLLFTGYASQLDDIGVDTLEKRGSIPRERLRMILSFHPIIEADENIICAGRLPDEADLAAIRRAAAVILPQGCSEALYRMARTHCTHIFPNMDVRFAYPGKRGQIDLFRKLSVAHPPTDHYEDEAAFRRRPSRITLPLVVKLDWGGEGETVFKASDREGLAHILDRIKAFERTGQKGFLVQQFVPTRQRSLRVTVIGRRLIGYWRIQSAPDRFGTSLAGGAYVDHAADPHLRKAAEAVVRHICRSTGLQLAGFDFIFNRQALDLGRIEPLALEINYFFGRTGLGGTEAYYRMLEQEVRGWLADLKFTA